eukprot:1169896-Amphidinium_carterae.1
MASRCLVHLEMDRDILCAQVHGQLLGGEVYLSAEEEEVDSVMALALLSNDEAPPAEAASSLPVKQSAGRGARRKAPSLAAPSLVSPPGKGTLLAEQEVHGLAQKLRAQKAKSAAKSGDVGELATALLQGMQGLGDRLSKLEGAQAQSRIPGACPAAPAYQAGRPLAGAGTLRQRDLFMEGVLRLRRGGLLSPRVGGHPAANAASRSYQAALAAAQTDPSAGRGADAPPTRGREKGVDRAL